MNHNPERERQRRWRRIHRRLQLHDALRPPIAVIARKAVVDQVTVSSPLLQPWLAYFDEAFGALYLLFYQAHRQRFNVKPGNPAFLFLAGRALNLVSAVRHLVVAGFDQAARPLVRGMVENLDLALAVLDDEFLADTFVTASEQEDTAKRFWRNIVARGGLHQRVQRIADKYRLAQGDAAWLARHRQESADILSRSVHASFNAAFLSTFVPSIHAPGQFVLEPLAEISVYTPQLLDLVTKELHVFTALVLRIITTEPPPELFRSVDVKSVLFQSMVAAVMLVEELVVAHSEDIDSFIQQISLAEEEVAAEGRDA